MGFFRLDGPFFKYGTILADVIILSFLWCVCSFPVFIVFSFINVPDQIGSLLMYSPLLTIGAASTALYYVFTRVISKKEGYVTTDFFKSFFSNYFQITGITVLLGVLLILLYFSFYVNNNPVFAIFQIFFALEIAFTLIFAFPLQARIKMGFFQTLKTAYLMSHKHIFTSVTCLMLFGAFVYICLFYTFFILFAPAVYAYITSYMFMRIFKKYLPEMDTDVAYN